MNFLEICQRVRQEAGISGIGPTSVLNQTGIMLKIVRWVQRAYLDIQNEEVRGWRWLWREGSFTTEVGKRTYSTSDLMVQNFNQWEQGSLFVRRPIPTQRWPLIFMEYEPFRNFYSIEQPGQVLHYTFLPNKSLRFDFIPSEAETVEYEYWRSPFQLTENADVPAFPEHHHDIVVYKALMYYAADEEAGAIYTDAQVNYLRYLARLRESELMRPHVSMGSLA